MILLTHTCDGGGYSAHMIWHHILREQIEKHLGKDPEIAPPWESLLSEVSETYARFEKSNGSNQKEDDKFLEEIQSVARLGTYILDFAAGIWKSSAILDEVFGIDGGFVRSVEGWASLVHPDDRKMMLDYFANDVVGGSHHFDKEYRIIRKNSGEERWVHGLGRVDLDAEGRPLKMIGTIQDITDRKMAEIEIKKEQDRTRQYIDIVGAIIVVIDSRGIVSLVNRKGSEILGYSEQDIVGKNWFDTFIPKSQQEDLKNAFTKLVSGDISLEHYENRIVTAAGEERLIAWHNVLLKDEKGAVQATLSSGEDITEKNKQEEGLQKKTEELQRLNNLMIGREVKMIELKKEIESLKSKPEQG